MKQMMKAIVFTEYGDESVLMQVDHLVPDVTENTIQIRVIAAAVNPADISIRNGRFRFFLRLNLPFILGADVAGIVTKVGDGVNSFKEGDKVYAMLPTRSGGAYAEYAVIDQSAASHIPTMFSYSQSAAIPLAGLTALQALRDQANLQNGQRVLINGASGGVGTFAVQIAKAMGAHVTAVCSTRNLAMVQELGADEVIDYTLQPITQIDQQFDVLLDAVALLSFEDGLNLVKKGGVMVSLNPGMGNPLFKLRARLRGKRITSLLVEPSGSDLNHMTALADQGQLRPVIDRIYKLDDVQQAHKYSDTKRARGKIVIAVDSQLADMIVSNKSA